MLLNSCNSYLTACKGVFEQEFMIHKDMFIQSSLTPPDVIHVCTQFGGVNDGQSTVGYRRECSLLHDDICCYNNIETPLSWQLHDSV